MTEKDLPPRDLTELAEEAMSDKRREASGEGEVRELYDVPSEVAGDLAREQGSNED